MRAFLSVLAYALFIVFNTADAERASPCQNAFMPNLFYANAELHAELFNKFIEEQSKRLEAITHSIEKQTSLIEKDALHLIVQRGIIYFFIGQLGDALNDFNHVIENLRTEAPLDKHLLGTALWGRMLCHAFGGQGNQTYHDSGIIALLFDECSCHENQEGNLFIPAKGDNYFNILPIAKFAYPEEKVSKWECHDRTNRITNKMRSLAQLIPVYIVRETVIWTIERQSQKAHKCCENGKHWTECLGPIADVWKKLEDTWDELVDLFNKGINLDLFLTSPSNL